MECNFIALTQHILSEGHTHYSRLVGTVAITICAVAIQIGVSRLFRLPTIVYAVSYVPSALFLAAITDLIPDFSLLKLAVYILILIACVSFCIYRQQRSRQRQRNHTFINAAIPNTIIITAIMLFTGFAGNTKRIMHYEMNAEYFLDSNNFEDAIRTAILAQGDTDTKGAICGSIAEAHYEIPEEMITKAYEYLPADMLEIVDQFYTTLQGHIKR